MKRVLNLGPEFLTLKLFLKPNNNAVDSRKGRLSVDLVLGLGNIDSTLSLNQLKKIVPQKINHAAKTITKCAMTSV